MAMHNLPHPGEFIIQVYLDPNNLSGRKLAWKLDVNLGSGMSIDLLDSAADLMSRHP